MSETENTVDVAECSKFIEELEEVLAGTRGHQDVREPASGFMAALLVEARKSKGLEISEEVLAQAEGYLDHELTTKAFDLFKQIESRGLLAAATPDGE